MNRPTQQRRTTAADLHIAPGTHVTAKVAAVWDGQVITRTVRHVLTRSTVEPVSEAHGPDPAKDRIWVLQRPAGSVPLIIVRGSLRVID